MWYYQFSSCDVWVDEFTLVTPLKNKDSPCWYKDKRVTWDSLIIFKGKWEYKKK